MIDIEKELSRIDKLVSDKEMFLEYGALSLAFFGIREYADLICTINEERDKKDRTVERENFIPLYKRVYWAERKKLYSILKNIQNRTLKLSPMLTEEEIKGLPLQTLCYDDKLNPQDNLYHYAENRIKFALNVNGQELYLLRNHPSVYYNHKSSYIGGDFEYRYKNEIIIYKNTHALMSGIRRFITYTNDRNSLTDQRVLLNILAYLNGRPNFELTPNPRFNQKLDDLYRYFDLMDCIKLRNSKYLMADSENDVFIELPIIKNIKYFELVIFKEMEHEGVLDLYHASLKQFEPLPRCIFLYRVFEYAVDNDYKTKFHPTNYKAEDAIEYYLNKALDYNPNPLYCVRFSEKGVEMSNFFSVLKTEAKKIFVEWSKHPYLKNKTKGEIIYLTGRNFTVHGGNGERNMQYDYGKNYLHINNINIVLELIARYVIELLNPNIRNVIEKRKKYYLVNYEKMFHNNQE